MVVDLVLTYLTLGFGCVVSGFGFGGLCTFWFGFVGGGVVQCWWFGWVCLVSRFGWVTYCVFPVGVCDGLGLLVFWVLRIGLWYGGLGLLVCGLVAWLVAWFLVFALLRAFPVGLV